MIKIENLTKSFSDNHVLKDLNLEIRDGEIMFIVGKSGSGKSVLLKHVMGLMKPDHGSVHLDDTDMTKLEGKALYDRLRNVGMIFQMGALFDSMTVGENVTFYLENHAKVAGHDIDRSTIRQLGEEALKSVELEGTYDMYPSELSGGMKKRASVARGVCYQPDYLFYDEPTTGLDPITAQRIAELIVKQHEALQGTTVVVSHDIVTTLYCAHRIALIENGVIEVCDTPMKFMKTKHDSIDQFNRMIGKDLSLIRNKG